MLPLFTSGFYFSTEGLHHPDPAVIGLQYYNPALPNKNIIKVAMIEWI